MEIMEAMMLGAELLQTAITVGDVISQLSPRRKCSVHITNLSDRYVLANPGMYTYRGRCIDPLPPIIRLSSSGSATFVKTPCTGRGFFGIFTYNLLDNSTQKATDQMAIMFKVPYNSNVKSNKYAVGVFDVSRECDINLYKEMLVDANTTSIKGQAKGPPLTLQNQDVDIGVTMSDCRNPVIKVYVSDKKCFNSI